MNKSKARNIMNKTLAICAHLNDMDPIIGELPDERERKKLLACVTNVLIELDAGLMRPIVRQYPDLAPEA